MPKFFPMQTVGEEYLQSAPKRMSDSFDIPRPAADVWADITADKPLDWCRVLNVEWTSPRPFGVGTTRTAKILGAVSAHEHFFAWEEGRRYAFTIIEATAPVFKSLAEDYVVEPTGDASCRFTWTVLWTPSALGKPGGPVNNLLFGSLFKDTRKHYGIA